MHVFKRIWYEKRSRIAVRDLFLFRDQPDYATRAEEKCVILIQEHIHVLSI